MTGAIPFVAAVLLPTAELVDPADFGDRADAPVAPAALKPEPLLLAALAGVLRSARDGELPLFVRTLGMAQSSLLRMAGCCFPALDYHEPIPERKYAALLACTPPEFHRLHALLMAQRGADADPTHADWLARALAAACLGQRFLWQDLGLSGREELETLLRRYFGPLTVRNGGRGQWKHFLMHELGAAPAARLGAGFV
ncbi:nitrogen fixation protein NifQ [Duganella sp. LX20W]|uniref:Nitrogen fixation protein NifQ n=1 Tax=Rugamonas brunnea TaxID=2758569 RepID=A0A7W2IBI3_9BURK|nr:nitrogen fixation protein NifQ [Rugamonas brunnea]MBA5637496.1 nitrogen fixation protein NifQ [Rugamonas brunnea]